VKTIAKKLLNEADVLARMAGNFQEQTEKIKVTPETITTIESPVEFPSKEIHGNGKKNTYEKKFLSRDICGIFRANVGVSKDTLSIAERIIARVFDNKIAVGAYVDNILMEHFSKYREDFEVWLVERPATIF
jgi:hypothetical protein